MSRPRFGQHGYPRSAPTLLNRAAFDPRQIPNCILWATLKTLGLPVNTIVGLWPDASGFGHDFFQLTSSKKPVLDEGGLYFDGFDDSIPAPNTSAFNFAASGHEATVGLWAKPANANNAWAFNKEGEYRLGWANDGSQILPRILFAGTTFTSSTSVSVDWHFFLYRLSTVTQAAEIFVDGELNASFSPTGTTGDQGNSPQLAGIGISGTFEGLVREVVAFDRFLSDSELAKLYRFTGAN
jgi:hypothetical protein